MATSVFTHVGDVKQLAKRIKRGETTRSVREYAVFCCSSCKTEFSILKSTVSRQRAGVFREHLAACPGVDDLNHERQVRRVHAKKRTLTQAKEEEVSTGSATAEALREIESYAHKSL